MWLLLATLSSLAVRAQEPAATPTAAAEVQAPSANEPVVTAVELLSDAPIDDVDAALELITLQVGAPYDEREVRRTLRNLEASGLAAEAEIWTRPGDAGTGVVVMAAIWTNVLVESVEITGEDRALSNETLRRELQVKEGEPLIEDRVVRSVFRLLDRYRAEGYFDATARTRVSLDAARKRARVGFAVAAGPRANIGQVAIDGALGPFAPARLVAALRARPGESYRQSTVRDDAERLRRWLHEQGYRQAEVELLSERYDPGDHLVDLAYRVETHGKLTVHVEGAELATLRRKDLLPFLGDQGYDEAVVLQAVARITRWYQERGHYRVQVEHREERQGEDIDLTLVVKPGPEYTLREVRFTGNEGVPASQLQTLMTTGEKRLLVAGSGKLVDEVLEADLDNVRSYYALSGWTQAKVGPPEVTEAGEGGLALTIPIVEGPRTRVVDLTIDGVKSLDVEALRKALPLQSGGPFHPRLLDETLDLVRGRYEGEGYPYAQVSATTDWNEDHTLVDVTLRVMEGPQQLAANLIVRGNRHTDVGVVRMLAGVVRGEVDAELGQLGLERGMVREAMADLAQRFLRVVHEAERDVGVDLVEHARQLRRRVGLRLLRDRRL
ncbi:MAG TPA: POTRA domain-containing protein, partial [Thermoanaerobaculia bacterium]|nr:POTRA domain-containing protein [Thermoanaerobaculia bacterium]